MAQSLMETKSSEIMEHRPSTGVVIRTEAATLMEVISKAAGDPNTDVAKLERLMAMYERITAMNAKSAFASAFAIMQPELPEIPERGKGHSGKYALWEDINALIKPVLGKHGFGISFRVGRQGDRLTVTGILTHREGHSEETTMELPADKSGSKNDVQSIGSSTSYGKRYVAQAILNLTSRDGGEQDDDGVAGSGQGFVTEEQVHELDRMLRETKSNFVAFFDLFKIKTLGDLPAAKYADALRKLKIKADQIAAAKKGEANG